MFYLCALGAKGALATEKWSPAGTGNAERSRTLVLDSSTLGVELGGQCSLPWCVTSLRVLVGKKSPYKVKLLAYMLEEWSALQHWIGMLCVLYVMCLVRNDGGNSFVLQAKFIRSLFKKKKPQRPFACRNSKSVTWKPGMKNLYSSKISYRVETVLFKYHRQQIFKSSIINGIKDRY